MPKWEYRSVDLHIGHGMGGAKSNTWDEMLNALGAEGWELVSIVVRTTGGSTSSYYATLKRPRHDAEAVRH